MSKLADLIQALREDAKGCDTSFCGVKPYTPCPRCCRIKAAADALERTDRALDILVAPNQTIPSGVSLRGRIVVTHDGDTETVLALRAVLDDLAADAMKPKGADDE